MKPQILYCDDQEKFLNEFIKTHRDDFDIETISDVHRILPILEQRKRLPDLVLLDLYHPKNVPNQSELAKKGNETLDELSKLMERVKHDVDAAWAPVAIEVLEEIRQHYSSKDLPVLLYTQQGLALLEDNRLSKVEKNEADWLIKDRGGRLPQTETVRIRRHIKRCKEQGRLARDIKISLVTTLVGAILGVILARLFG